MTQAMQNAVVFVLVAIAAAYVVVRIGKTLFRNKASGSCGGCAGCPANAAGTVVSGEDVAPVVVPIETLLKRSPQS